MPHGDIHAIKTKVHAVRTDPTASGLVIIEIPLSEPPDPEWIDCFNHPRELVPSLHARSVSGRTIQIKADKSRPQDDVEWIYKFIEEANECYRQALDLLETKRRAIGDKTRKEKEELDRITDELRKI